MSEKTWRKCALSSAFRVTSTSLRSTGVGIRSILLCRALPAARRMYLFRDEYILELETAVIAETPKCGHATYIFAKPRNMETFLAVYTRTTKSSIQRNNENVAERLGFLCRVVHGGNPHSWLENIRQIVGGHSCASARRYASKSVIGRFFQSHGRGAPVTESVGPLRFFETQA